MPVQRPLVSTIESCPYHPATSHIVPTPPHPSLSTFSSSSFWLLYSIGFCLYLQINLDPNSGIFITMNPAGKGYGGRQKLPDNLKQLFRPVAMSRPDNEQIAEVILFSEGFKEAKPIGRKLVAVFNLSK